MEKHKVSLFPPMKRNEVRSKFWFLSKRHDAHFFLSFVCKEWVDVVVIDGVVVLSACGTRERGG